MWRVWSKNEQCLEKNSTDISAISAVAIVILCTLLRSCRRPQWLHWQWWSCSDQITLQTFSKVAQMQVMSGTYDLTWHTNFGQLCELMFSVSLGARYVFRVVRGNNATVIFYRVTTTVRRWSSWTWNHWRKLPVACQNLVGMIVRPIKFQGNHFGP